MRVKPGRSSVSPGIPTPMTIRALNSRHCRPAGPDRYTERKESGEIYAEKLSLFRFLGQVDGRREERRMNARGSVRQVCLLQVNRGVRQGPESEGAASLLRQ